MAFGTGCMSAIRMRPGLQSTEGENMHSTLTTAREARARRLADKQGLRLIKSRRSADASSYALVTLDTNCAAFGVGPIGYDADLAGIEEYLAE